MIKRSFTDRTKETIMALYKSHVRPHLEYCVPIWSPYLIKDIKLVALTTITTLCSKKVTPKFKSL